MKTDWLDRLAAIDQLAQRHFLVEILEHSGTEWQFFVSHLLIIDGIMNIKNL